MRPNSVYVCPKRRDRVQSFAPRGGWLVLLAFAIVMCSACAPKGMPPIRPTPAEGEALFSEAEQLFEQKLYEDALAAYQSYLAQYPDQSLADAALMKIGMIFSATGNSLEEKRAFERILTDYPESPYAPDARLAVLTSLYREGNHSAAIEQANILLGDTFLSRSHVVRIYTLLGDIYTTNGFMPEAMEAYAHAYERASVAERPAIRELLDEAISALDTAEIEWYLKSPPADNIGGFLLYQLGLGFAEVERDRESMLALGRMIELYPEHPLTKEARGLLEILARKSRYNRLTIGCLLPLTGAYKAYGQRALKGVELALSRFAERQPDARVQIIVKDTGGDPDRARAAVNELYAAQVAAIVGPIVTARPAAEESQKNGIPIITLTGKTGVPEVGDYVFRNFITPRMQINSLISYTRHTRGLKRFAILYPDEKYGRTLMNFFWDAAIENDAIIVGAEAYASQATDFGDPIEKLVGLYYELPEHVKLLLDQREAELAEAEADSAPSESLDQKFAEMAKEWLADNIERELFETGVAQAGEVGDSYDGSDLMEEENGEGDFEEPVEEEPKPIVDFEAIFIPDAPSKAGLIIPQLAFYDVENVVLLGTNLWHSSNLIKMAKGYVQGAIVPDGFFVDSQLPHVQAFVRAFESIYNQPPGFIEAVSYDSALMLFELVNQPEILFRSALRDGIATIEKYPGVTGKTSFDEQGDAKKELFLLEIKKDRFQSIDSGN